MTSAVAKPPPALRALRRIGQGARLPGFFTVVLEPIHRRLGTYPTLTTATSVGTMELDLRDYNQRRIFYFAHEERESRFLRRLLRPGDAVVDVGANVGYFSLLAAAAVSPSGEVHAFEPIPANFATLERNVGLNDLPNVSATRAAAGRMPGRASFGIPDGIASDLGETSAMYTRAGVGNRIDADVVVLDPYVAERFETRPVRLVKIDVEGVEPDVLAGLERALGRQQPDSLLVEVNRDRLRDHGYDQEDVLRPLEEHGYRLFRLDLLGRPQPLDRTWGRSRPLYNVIALAPRILVPRGR